MSNLEWIADEVFCDVHDCIHPTDLPITVPNSEIKCGPPDWRRLYVGGPYEEERSNDGVDSK